MNNRFFSLITMGIFLFSIPLTAQTVNFEETWKEFLENNKISNMSALDKPNKDYDPLNYIKYLLMNTNSSFCQSDIERAEALLAGINDIETRAHQAIPGFVQKLDDMESKVNAYHSIDAIWQEFLQTRTVDIRQLEDIKAAKTLCEKQTLAKYSYMTAYHHYCQGNVPRAKNIIENRTLKLTEKTTLRVEDVEGLGEEVAKMKTLFQNMTQLDANWKSYLKTGVSPGFDAELPLFPCNPIPNMKEWVLKGAVDVCNAAPTMLEKIKDMQAESGVAPKGELAKKVKELEAAIAAVNANLTVLNQAWEAFLPNNEVKKELRKYSYEYCKKEPLIRAYIMDGFANVCGNAEDRLQKIDAIQQSNTLNLSDITLTKIDELTMAYLQLDADERDINELWNAFVAQGNKLYEPYQLAEYYCDHVYDVKSWLIQAFDSDCKQGIVFLQQIDEVKKNLEFEFTKDVRCRIQELRITTWDCQYEAVSKLARIQAPEAFEERVAALMEEYGMGPRPEPCEE